ncbi:MAG: alpha/beta hydrolase [Synechococcales bacterium]|nr:alpha/beta hydrolase [Synechococcales bacterium]
MGYHILAIEELGVDKAQVTFPCYFVVSTAPINIEDQSAIDGADPHFHIEAITQHLNQQGNAAEILVLIHGYNTGRDGVRNWYRNACEYIAQHYPNTPKGLVVLGYRWSSEQVTEDESGKFLDKRNYAKQSLPTLMDLIYRYALIGILVGLAGLILTIAIALLKGGISFLVPLIFSLIFLFSLLAVSPIFTIFVLRLSVYFRDTYRANHYGVSDLVELIRQLDNALVDLAPQETREQRQQFWESRRIRLSFIGHSMGGFVVTNAVRVLSDVFDQSSIGRLDLMGRKKLPSAKIGNVFSLGRLVLVAPDMTAEAVISGRANVLRSSLRRFEEAYLFCSEGDMALRLASTTANYFTFPAKTRDGGYRLGNMTVRDAIALDNIARTGIANLNPEGRLVTEQQRPFLSYLHIRRSRSLLERQQEITLSDNQKSIAELFTYFDCTNYCELVANPKTGKLESVGVITRALRKTRMNFWDYFWLTMDFFSGKLDPHGGYIFSPIADFSKQAIYGVACLGWSGFMTSLQSEPEFEATLTLIQTQRPELTPRQQTLLAGMMMLHQVCDQRGIQVLVSPERYEVDIMGQICDRTDY